MTMTKEEIVREYREAKYPEKQIRILADENQCAVKDIREILTEAGCLLPRQKKDSPESESGEGREPQSVAENKDEWPEEDPAGYSAALREIFAREEKPAAPMGLVLTVDQAWSLAEHIDCTLFGTIRENTDIDSMKWLREMVHAYEALCAYSGYRGITEGQE